MQVAEWPRITKTDHQDMPEWFEKIASQINRQMELLTTLAFNNVNFKDNFQAEIRTIEVVHDTSVPIQLQRLKRNPIGALLIWSSNFDYPRLKAQMNPDRPLTVDVSVKWDSVPAANPTVTILFIGA